MRHTYGSSLAPDGSAIAYIVRDHGYPHAVQMQLEPDGAGLGEERYVKLPIDGPVTKVLHSPDAKWIACEVSPHGTERLETWLVSTDPDVPGATPLRLPADSRTTLVEWDNELLAMNAVTDRGVTQARLVDPRTSRYEVIDQRSDSLLVAAENGYGLVRVGPRGHHELLLVGPDMKWNPLLPPDPGSTTDAGVIIAGAHDGKLTAFVLSDHGVERTRVLRLDVNGIDVSVEEFISNPDQDVEEFLISDDASTAAVLWNNGGVSSLEVLTLGEGPQGDGIRVQVRRTVELPGMVASELSISGDGSLISVTVEGPGLPPTVEILSTTGGTVDPVDPARTQRILDAEQALSEQCLIPELVHFTSRDGLELSGWLYLPEDFSGKGPGAAFIHIHGGPELQAKPINHDILAALVQSGMTVFTPNLRGSKGSGRSFEHAGDRYGRFAAIRDIEAATNFLIDSGLADPKRIVLGGRSYGGFMSLMAAAWYPDTYAAIIDACGMTSFETYYKSTEPWLAQAAYTRYGYPYQDAELLRDLSPVLRADEMKAPTLFIHGEWDTNVLPRESGQMRDSMDAYGVTTEFLLVPGEGHKFAKPKSRRLIAHTMLDFLKRQGIVEKPNLNRFDEQFARMKAAVTPGHVDEDEE
ncbi:alpha/beta hydrolase family protein [Corynebacterium sp. H78]|uniref:alpha/beta hydrolase family protein n=1 Tax=Corynebacterium sp. H78 TaxID=3133417 RepID=UPI00309F682D